MTEARTARDTRPLHVVQIAPPWYRVPPDGYGGIEFVVALLVAGLRGRGHRVTLFAAEGSDHPVAPAPSEWQPWLGTPEERLLECTWATSIVDRLASMDGVDVVHDHVGHTTLLACSLVARGPVFHTVHGPLTMPDRVFYAALDERIRPVAISNAQRETAPALRWAATVHNAIDVDGLVTGVRPADDPYLLWLARIHPDKGQHLAIEVARAAGMRLVLAGKIDDAPAGREYFDERVRPAIDGRRVVHIDNVAGREKADLLAGATALVAPLCWDEPFGLALVEAMASGTPAVAFRRGATPELVEEGRTGFVVDDADAMLEAVRRAGEIDRAACAARARERFDAHAMVSGYLEAYETALEARR